MTMLINDPPPNLKNKQHINICNNKFQCIELNLDNVKLYFMYWSPLQRHLETEILYAALSCPEPLKGEGVDVYFFKRRGECICFNELDTLKIK